MTVSAVEVLRGFDADGVAYRQLASADPENGAEVMSIIAAGDVFPRFIAVNGEKHAIGFDTQQVATILGQCGLFGADVSPLTLYYQKVSNLSGRDADDELVHSQIDAADCRMYINNITAGNRTSASAKGRVVPVSDGTNAPLIRTGSVAVTDAAPTTAENFVLGPISLNGTAIEGCNGLDVNLAPKEMELSDESFNYTTFAANETITPVISFTTTSPSAPSLHKAILASGNKFKAHLIRKKKNEERYAANESQHIKFEVVSGIILVQAVSGSPREYRVEVHCSGVDADGFDGVPLTVAVNTAIVL